MYKLSNKVIKIIKKAMENWKLKLTSREQAIAEVKIQWSSFQGDSLLPQQFIWAIISLNYSSEQGGYKFIQPRKD